MGFNVLNSLSGVFEKGEPRKALSSSWPDDTTNDFACFGAIEAAEEYEKEAEERGLHAS